MLTTSEATNEIEVEPKITSFVSAIRPTNALNLIILVNDALQDDSGLHGLMKLQLLLLDIGHIPTLMAHSTDQVLPLLEKHIEQVKQPPQSASRPSILPTALVAHATSTAPAKPLSEHNANILTDLFLSIKQLEEGTRTVQGQENIRSYFDAKTAKEVIEFWEDEWLV